MSALRVAIVGCGLIGAKRAAALSEDDTVVACYDIDGQAARGLAAQHGIQACATLDELFASGADVVVVATVHDQLAGLAERALQSGAHVLVEKPAGVSSAQIERLIECQRASGRLVKVGFNHRFHPGIARAAAEVRSGRHGELMHLRARYGHGGRPGYDREWRAQPARSGGGELIDQGMHLLDLTHWLAGPLELHSGLLRTHFWDTPVEDNAALILGDAGSRTDPWAMLHVSWTEWKNMFSLEIYCRTAKLQVDGLVRSYGPQRLRIYKMSPDLGPPELEQVDYADQDDSWQLEWASFVAAIDAADEALVCGDLGDAHYAWSQIEAAYADGPYAAMRDTVGSQSSVSGSAAPKPAAQVGQGERLGVVGLWHLGSVTAACLAEAGYDVLGVDPDPVVVQGLLEGRPPVSEPGLPELLAKARARLRFSADPQALAGLRYAWVTFDTPVDDDDHADVGWVLDHAVELLAPLADDALVIVSSQMPVGSVAALRERCAARRGQRGLRFACVPENLRLGSALEAFRAPDRIVAGVSCERDRDELAAVLAPIGANVEWMRVESAEMTKHALNGFLATSVAFINEVATICESVGADAAEVSRGLKSERRIGPRAYLGPGDAFAGGTLARDISFLRELARRHWLPDDVFAGVASGNAAHKSWAQRKLVELLGANPGAQGGLSGATVGIWGLTYKPGTDTLRRSSAVELCRWLLGEGASVRAHDPAVESLPAELEQAGMRLCATPLAAADGAGALVVCTAWPEYREVSATQLLSVLQTPLVVDAAGFLAGSMGVEPGLSYVRVGSPSHQVETLPDEAAVRSEARA